MVFAEKTPIFNRFYWYPEGVEKPDLKKNIVISKILLAWLATVPVALGTTAGLCAALKNVKWIKLITFKEVFIIKIL